MSGPSPVYDRDGITVYHGDCLAILPTLAAGSVNAIVTDPPYGIEVGQDGYGRRQNYGGVGRFIENDSDLSALDSALIGSPRILPRNSWLALFCSPKRHSEAAALVVARGFPVLGEVVWDKAAPGLGGGIRYQHETILLCGHGKPSGLAPLFSVIRSFVPREGKHRRHPHEKPTEVMGALIRYCSRPGDTILDPFAGSGSTLVAAAKAGRRAIGIESDERWIPSIIRRLEAAKTPLFNLGETPR